MNWITDMFSGKDGEIKKQAELTNKETEWERKVEANDWVKDVMSMDEGALQQEADDMQHAEEVARGVDEFDEVGMIMAYEQGELSDEDTLKLFSELIKNGHAWSLQGHYGRTAKALIDAGWIDGKGNILKDISDMEATASERISLKKTAAYAKGDTSSDTIEKDYELGVKGLSDYNLAEMLAEYVCLENNTATLNHNEEKEAQLKSVKTGREAAEKKLLKYLGDHSLIDWKKSFKAMEESEVKHPEEKDLYSEWKAGKMAWEGKKAEFEAPSDKEKVEQMDGVGKEEEKGQVGKEASKKLQCPKCGSSDSVTPAHDNKLNKCDACHYAFDNESAKNASIKTADEMDAPEIMENPVPAEPAVGDDAKAPVTDVVPEATPDMAAPMADVKPGIDDKITTKIDEKIEEKAEEIVQKIEDKIEEHADEMAAKVEEKVEEKIEEAFNNGPVVEEGSPEDKVLDEMHVPHLEPGETPKSEMKEWEDAEKGESKDKKEDKPKAEKSEDKKEEKKDDDKDDKKEDDKKEDKKDEKEKKDKEDKESSLKTEAGFNGWKNYETWNIALWFDYDENLRTEKVGFLKTGAKSGSDIAAFVMELLPTGTPDFEGKSSRYLKANWDEIAEAWKGEAGEPTITSQASKADVLKKVAEISSPWQVIKNERGEEVIARVSPTKTEKKSKEKDLKNGINSQDLR